MPRISSAGAARSGVRLSVVDLARMMDDGRARRGPGPLVVRCSESCEPLTSLGRSMPQLRRRLARVERAGLHAARASSIAAWMSAVIRSSKSWYGDRPIAAGGRRVEVDVAADLRSRQRRARSPPSTASTSFFSALVTMHLASFGQRRATGRRRRRCRRCPRRRPPRGRPGPTAPATWKITSASGSIICLAIDAPVVGSLKALRDVRSRRTATRTSMSGLTDFAPLLVAADVLRRPAGSVSMPPMAPMTPLSLMLAATMPAR